MERDLYARHEENANKCASQASRRCWVTLGLDDPCPCGGDTRCSAHQRLLAGPRLSPSVSGLGLDETRIFQRIRLRNSNKPPKFQPVFPNQSNKKNPAWGDGFRGPLCFRGGRARERPVEGVGVPASSQVEAVSRGSGKDVIACARVPVHPPSPCVTPAPRT